MRVGGFLVRVPTFPNPHTSFTMDREVSIVLSVERGDYRRVAQKWYGLTDEQMVGMDVHHNPPVSQGGRNIPEHLFVYHPTLHVAVHGSDFVGWARAGAALAHLKKDENGKSIVALKMIEKRNAQRDERGKCIVSVRGSAKTHSRKNADGKSIVGVNWGTKAAAKLHAERTEDGRSIHGIRFAEKVHAKKTADGKSEHAVRRGQNLNKEMWKCLVTGKITNAGALTKWQRARGIDPSNRVKVTIKEEP